MDQKKTKSFRISARNAALVRKAAAAESVSESEIIERCISAQANQIISDSAFLLMVMNDPRASDILARKLGDG